MTDISKVKSSEYTCKNTSSADINKKNEDININDISILYTTEKEESKRTSFSDTYSETKLKDAEQGNKFLQGLKDYRNTLTEKLGLSSEQYDSLACIALALASQETGMGFENGYDSENQSIGKFFRSIAKQIDVWFGGASASSGLTQMKIYDFMNSDKLSQSQKDILTDLGVEVYGISDNNLYSEPDKSAAATIVVLDSIVSTYDKYVEVLAENHSETGKNLNDGLTESQRIDKGNDILNKISDIYQKSGDADKVKIRSAFKQWLLSQNGSKIGDRGVDKEYNEEYQLQAFNNLLAQSSDLVLQQEDLDYIRYALTSSGQEMTMTEYCAYGWNKGTTDTGMQPDRLLADKVGIILSNPEDFDYDQFTVNVASLADKYAQQSTINDGLLAINNAFLEEEA